MRHFMSQNASRFLIHQSLSHSFSMEKLEPAFRIQLGSSWDLTSLEPAFRIQLGSSWDLTSLVG